MREIRVFSNAILRLIPRCMWCDFIVFSACAKSRDKLIIQIKLLGDIRAGSWSIFQAPHEVLSVNFSAQLRSDTHYFVPAPKQLNGDQMKEVELRGERHLARMGRREIHTEFW
jgi:hypothetical protein